MQFTYTLSNFSTAPIPPSMFDLPPHWEATCTDSDGGVRKAGLPGRQAGYLCVDPEHKVRVRVRVRVTVRVRARAQG